MPTWRVLLLLATVLLLCLNAAFAARVEAKVVGVTDGDTLVVLDGDSVQHKVRLAGIDAPEKKQAFGARAQQTLAVAVHRKTVVLDWHKKDRNGRLIAKVLIGNRDVGLELVASGFAWHYKAYEREQSTEDRLGYAAAELKARQRRSGLWADSAPVPPWEFRRQPKAPRT